MGSYGFLLTAGMLLAKIRRRKHREEVTFCIHKEQWI